MGSLNTSRRQFILASFSWIPWFWHPDERNLADIRFRVIRRGRSGRRYLVIHGNEETARKVLSAHMDQAHGSAYLVKNDKRNIDFRGADLDPNRLFSDTGAYENLRKLNPGWPAEKVNQALARLNRKRHELIEALTPRRGDVLIALHNNSDAYSVNDELAISDRTALNDAANPHEFCLCTSSADFERLRSGPYNVVLQDRTPQDDDGSLSRLAARAGFRYVNIEAGMGQFDKQQTMLQWIEQTLPAASNSKGTAVSAQTLDSDRGRMRALGGTAERLRLGSVEEGFDARRSG